MNLKSRDYISKTFLFLVLAFGVLNLLQAGLTPLYNDEAYYWMYSNNMAWGYFDHPPMIALMIRIGYFLFHNELGVRLIGVLSIIISLVIIWSLIENDQRIKRGNVFLFFMLVAILPVFNIYGFLATPDAPLLFFTSVFLLTYNRFINKDNLSNTTLLGISMVALMYSKYHGALLIIFVILSNLKLLKNPRFYLASIFALILFIPHLYWQYANDFPSIKYHLVDRVSGFVPGNVPEYILNQLAIHNPFILPLFIWLIFKVKTKNQFEKTLNFIVIGFFAFFFIASFRYHIEPQWTALIAIPMVIILLNNLNYESVPGNYIKWVAIVLFPLFVFVRIAFIVDFLPVSYIKKEFHNNKKWAQEIGRLAGDRPVVFTNSYQNASEYTFYTGKFAHSLNNLNYRKTQYDLWNFEERIHGEEILYVPHFLTDYIAANFTKHIMPSGDSIYVKVYRDFQSLQRECAILTDEKYAFRKSEPGMISMKIFNPYPYPINLKNKEFPVVFQLAFIKNGILDNNLILQLPDSITSIGVGETILVDTHFTLEAIPVGTYKLAVCSETGILYITYNSRAKDVTVKE